MFGQWQGHQGVQETVDQPEAIKNAVRESVLAAVTDRYLNGYVELSAKCWLVTARNLA